MIGKSSNQTRSQDSRPMLYVLEFEAARANGQRVYRAIRQMTSVKRTSLLNLD